MANQSEETFITTKDNPYDYWIQFDEWYAYDHAMGYYTLELLARLAPTSNDLSDSVNDELIDQAFDTMIRYNPNYVRVHKKTS